MMTDHTVTTEAIEEPKKYTVNCELPGLTIKDVAVEIDPEQRVLHISASAANSSNESEGKRHGSATKRKFTWKHI